MRITDIDEHIPAQLKAADEHSGEWRDEAEQAYAYDAGDQWDEEDRSYLEENLRPVITINRITNTINAVSGSEVANRQEAKYIPREQNDNGIAEIITAAAEWVRDQCDAEDHESDAFRDTLVCGMGWTNTELDYEVDPEGRINIVRVDPLEMRWDPSAKDRNLSDARWVSRDLYYSREEFLELWPDAEEYANTGEDGPTDNHHGEPHNATDAWKYEDDQSPEWNKNRGKIHVVEFQYYQVKSKRKVRNPDGGMIDFPEDRFQQYKAKTGFELRNVKVPYREYRRAYLVGGQHVIEDDKGPCEGHFTYQCVTGLRDRNDGTWFGLVRLMRDPQMWANKFFSQILHIVNSNAKGGLLAEEDAFVNPRKAQEEWAQPDSITLFKNGALSGGRVQEKSMPQFPAAIAQMMEYSISSIRDVTGVNLEMMGLAERQQAGVLEHQRKQAGLTILQTFFDSLRRYRKQQGRVLLYFIQHYISDGRIIRIMKDGAEQFIPLLRDASVGTYDVIVDESPTSPNQKQRTFEVMTQMLPLLGDNATPEIYMAILEYSPLPEAVKQKLREAAEQPDPEQEKQKQLMMAQAAADVEETQSKTMLNQAKAQSEAQQDPQAEHAMKMQEAQIKMGATLLKAQADKAKAQAQIQQTAMDTQASQQRAAVDADMMQRKASHDAEAMDRKAQFDERRQEMALQSPTPAARGK